MTVLDISGGWGLRLDVLVFCVGAAVLIAATEYYVHVDDVCIYKFMLNVCTYLI